MYAVNADIKFAQALDETGTVLWNTGHTGVFLDDGEYKSTGHSDRNGFHSNIGGGE